ncbi:hypothetical protein OBBRIDRAFT_797956 [Obba rivulosa]|uniref:Uncharacterized protein n=1 Tax=Obba rivulosa TaxID=1052685 RepID=A0A8E2DG60_9APHY|nr:hypothetical protein OBBRIDRAFT_797956 [Obba rivulosa]
MQLHCTVLNTIYRKPRTRNHVPFAYSAFLFSATLEAVALSSTEPATEEAHARLQGVGFQERAVGLGEWTVDEAQLCEIGRLEPGGRVCMHRVMSARMSGQSHGAGSWLVRTG